MLLRTIFVLTSAFVFAGCAGEEPEEAATSSEIGDCEAVPAGAQRAAFEIDRDGRTLKLSGHSMIALDDSVFVRAMCGYPLGPQGGNAHAATFNFESRSAFEPGTYTKDSLMDDGQEHVMRLVDSHYRNEKGAAGNLYWGAGWNGDDADDATHDPDWVDDFEIELTSITALEDGASPLTHEYHGSASMTAVAVDTNQEPVFIRVTF